MSTSSTAPSRVRASALLSAWLHTPVEGVVKAAPSLALDALVGADSLAVLAQTQTQAGGAHPLRTQHYARLATMLDQGGEQAWTAMQHMQALADEANASADAGADTSNSELRTHLDAWAKSLAKLLRTLLDPVRASSVHAPGLAPLLTLTAAETLVALLRRTHDAWPDARREIANTTLPNILPLVLKIVPMSDTHVWKATVPQSTANAVAAGKEQRWNFPPPDALERALRLLLDLLCTYRHSLRFGIEKIAVAVAPTLGHEHEIVRHLSARILAACALITPPASKKKQASATEDAEGEDETAAAAEEKKTQPQQATQPDDPWSLCFYRVLNTLHTLFDELDEAGDALLLEQGAWKKTLRPTDAVLPLPALPVPPASGPTAASSLARAHAFQLRVDGVCAVLVALLDRALFSELTVVAGGVAHADSVTAAVPVAALHACLTRLFTYELNPHQLGQITNRPMARTSVAMILPAMVRTGVNVLSVLLDFLGAHGQHLLLGSTSASNGGGIGATVRDLFARHAAFQASEQRHAVPSLLPDLYALAGQLLTTSTGSAGPLLVRTLVLPLLGQALEDAERVVRAKNALAQYARGASSMAAFTGAALLQNNKRRSTGGGNRSEGADDVVAYAASLHIDQASIIGVAALQFLDEVLAHVGALLPVQKRIQVDRSLLAIVLACQSVQSQWRVIDAYRIAVYTCLTSSVVTPIAPAPPSSVGSGSSEAPDNGALGAFSLLPYATQLFGTASLQDPAPSVRALALASLRICQTMLHPRSLPLLATRHAFANSQPSGGIGSGNADSMFDAFGMESSSGLAPGLVRGRDGALYMQAAAAAPAAVEEEEVPAAAVAIPAASSSSFEYTPAAAAAVPAAAAASVVMPRVGSKRGREEPTDMDTNDDEEEKTVSAPKRAHIEQPAAAAAAAAPDVMEDEDAAKAQDEDVLPAAAAAAPTPVAPVSSASASATSSVPATRDAVELVASAADSEDAEPLPAMVADDGPDADEGEQGSLWTL